MGSFGGDKKVREMSVVSYSTSWILKASYPHEVWHWTGLPPLRFDLMFTSDSNTSWHSLTVMPRQYPSDVASCQPPDLLLGCFSNHYPRACHFMLTEYRAHEEVPNVHCSRNRTSLRWESSPGLKRFPVWPN